MTRIPKHIGIIPDGNRRWAVKKGLEKKDGYSHGISPGVDLYRICRSLGVEELTFYGFTTDNTRRPAVQRAAFSDACVKAVEFLSEEDADLLVLGNTKSPVFPKELLPYTTRHTFGAGMGSADVSRVDLVIRWGGRRRLSGFLPIQSVYADIYVIDDYWPDFTPQHIHDALEWYSRQDITLGG